MVDAAFRLNHVDIEYITSHLTSGLVEEVAWREKASSFERCVPARVIGVQEKSVASFPLKMRHADSYISERVALIGFVWSTSPCRLPLTQEQ
jgi:ubiquinone biosynthesis monooxygenase Coq6